MKDPTSAEIFGIDIRELENEPIDIDIDVKNRYEADLKIVCMHTDNYRINKLLCNFGKGD